MNVVQYIFVCTCAFVIKSALGDCNPWSSSLYDVNCTGTGCQVFPYLSNTTCEGDAICVNDVLNVSSVSCTIGCNPDQILSSPNANAIDCSTAIDDNDSCSVVDASCTGTVTCQNGTYYENVNCPSNTSCLGSYFPSSTVSTYITDYGISINCTSTAPGSICDVDEPSDVQCFNSVFCNGIDGEYNDDGFSCVKVCNESYTSTSSYLDVDCQGALLAGSECAVTVTNASCTGTVTCQTAGYVSTLACAQWCSGTFGPAQQGVNCTNAIHNGTTCSVTDYSSRNCIGAVQCVDGLYVSDLQCSGMSCSNQSLDTNITLKSYRDDLDVIFDCASSTPLGQTCDVLYPVATAECSGFLTCGPNGNFESTVTCEPICSGAYDNSTLNVFGLLYDCSRATRNMSQCQVDIASCNGDITCDGRNYISTVSCDSDICSGQYPGPYPPGVSIDCVGALRPGQACQVNRTIQGSNCTGDYTCSANGAYSNVFCQGCSGEYIPTKAEVGASVNCTQAINNFDMCDVSTTNSSCSGHVMCTNSGYNSTLNCSTSCSGTYFNQTVSTWGITPDCSVAMDVGSQCLTSFNGVVCSGSVTCTDSGSYLSTLLCKDRCNGSFDDPLLTANGVSVNCSLATQTDEYCVLDYNATRTFCGGAVRCASGIYVSTAVCTPQNCTGTFDDTEYDDLLVDCTTATLPNSTCQYFILDNSYSSCEGAIKCIGGIYESNVTCLQWCDGQYFNQSLSAYGISTDCSTATGLYDTCSVGHPVGTNCIGNVSCMDSGYVSTVSCNGVCSGNYSSDILKTWGVLVDCSNAVIPNSSCMISMEPTSAYICSGDISCDSIGRYNDTLSCEIQCDGSYSNVTLDKWGSYDCMAAVRPGMDCVSLPLPTLTCYGALMCDPSGSYVSTIECYEQCDGMFVNTTFTEKGVWVDCSGALTEGSQCAVQLTNQCNTGYVVCTKGSYESFLGCSNCSGIYTNKTLEAWGVYVDCNIANQPGEICSSGNIDSQQCVGDVFCSFDGYHSTVDCNPVCSGIYQNQTLNSWGVQANCSTATVLTSQCAWSAGPQSSCFGDISCTDLGYRSLIECPSYVCSGTYLNPLAHTDVDVNCSLAIRVGDYCVIDTMSYCVGSVECTGDGTYRDTLSCQPKPDCTGAYFGRYENYVDCSLAVFLGDHCLPIPSNDVICNVSLECTQTVLQSSAEYTGSVECSRVPSSCPSCPCSNQTDCEPIASLMCQEGPPCCPTYDCSCDTVCKGKCSAGFTCVPYAGCSASTCVDNCLNGKVQCNSSGKCFNETCYAGKCSINTHPDWEICGPGDVCIGGQCVNSCSALNATCPVGVVKDCSYVDCYASGVTCKVMNLPNMTVCTTAPQGVCIDGVCSTLCSNNQTCPPSTECAYYKCNTGICQLYTLPVGSLCGNQGSGLCNSLGECEMPTCDSLNITCPTPPVCGVYECGTGSCSVAKVQPGTSCGDGMLCYGFNCLNSCDYYGIDCKPTDDCMVADCTLGRCDISQRKDGTKCGSNNAGICKFGVCTDICESVCGKPPSECTYFTDCTNGSCSLAIRQGLRCGRNQNGYCSNNGTCINYCEFYQLHCNYDLLSECQHYNCEKAFCDRVGTPDGGLCKNGTNGTCSGGRCVDNCLTKNTTCTSNNSSDECTYYDCASIDCRRIQIPDGTPCRFGVCENGNCQQGTTAFCGDLRHPCPFPKECSQGACVCPAAFTPTFDGNCVDSSVCSPQQISECQSNYSTCQIANSSTGLHPVCTPTPCITESCLNIPSGCRKKDITEQQLGPDGCPLYPCDYVCEGCTVDQSGACQAKGKLEGALYQCVIDNSTYNCVKVGCPAARCPPPPSGCTTEVVASSTGDGCPSQPCGRLVCPSTTCSTSDRVHCSAQTPRQDCIVIQDGVSKSSVSSCVPFVCPIVSCSSIPPGCHYVVTNITKAAFDQYGCPEFPCGALHCPEVPAFTCSDTQRDVCCDSNSCTQCLLDPSSGQPVCIDKTCDNTQTCYPTPGCYFKPSTATGVDGCPLFPCGVEVCEPYDICDNINNMEICPPGYSCMAVQGKARCVASQTCQEECQFGMTCIHGSCKPSDLCFDAVCPAGMTCMADSVFAVSACVAMQQANCPNAKECSEKGGTCVPVLQGSESVTRYQCVIPRTQSRCDLDECACSGTPCGPDEGCFIYNNTQRCLPVQKVTPFEIADLCASVVCPSDLERCVVTQGVTSCTSHLVAVTADVQSCGLCKSHQMCDTTTGSCLDPSCPGGCGANENCTFVNRHAMCVKNMCAPGVVSQKGFVWPPETCQSDSDCPNTSVCPRASTTLSGVVSAWCSCDPLSGQPETCSSRRLYGSKYCVPRIWDCSSVTDWDSTEYVNSSRRSWCCSVLQIGCSHYSCTPTEFEGSEEWPPAKADYCCKKTGIGCRTDQYDCRTSEEWTFTKRQYCCEQEGIGCPVDKFYCEGSLTPEAAVWCCKERSLGCTTELTDIFNCTSTEIWSYAKNDYCCKVHGLSCKTLKSYHDCYTTSPTSWSEPHRNYCCKQTSVGCRRTSPPYDCEDKAFLEGNKAASDWCCLLHELNCPAQVELGCDEETGVASDVCCSRVNKKCSYLCPSDALLQESLSQEQRAFCCQRKGIACTDQTVTVNGSRHWRNFLLLMSVSWNRIQTNPREYSRRLRATLQAVISVQQTSITLKQVGPAQQTADPNGEYSLPQPGSDLDYQKFKVPDSWQNDEYDYLNVDDTNNRNRDPPTRQVITLQVDGTDVYGSNPEVGEDAIFVSLTIDAPDAASLAAAQKELESNVAQAVSGEGMLAQNSEGHSYVVSPLQPVVDTGESGAPGSESSDSSASVPLIVCLVVAGVAVISLTTYKVLMSRRSQPEPSSFNGEQSVFTFEMLRYTATDSTESLDAHKKVIEEGNI